jgi:tetratricopeptide (TPR) repeat protein
MPKRPREHELETASQRAFESALPDAWLARRQSPDYGVDYIVEIFYGGEATGEIFGVQLKATGTRLTRPAVPIEVSKREYWASLDFPVMVVLWSATSDSLWWEWAHRYDPRLERPEQTKFTLAFPEANDLRDASAAATIRREVSAWRGWHGDLPRPIDVSVEVSAEGLGQARPGAVRMLLRRRLDPFRDIVQLRTPPSTLPHVTIDVSGEKTLVWAAGGASATLHHSDRDTVNRPEFVDLWVEDVLLLLGLRLVKSRARGMGARLIAGAVETATAVCDPSLASETVWILAVEHRIDSAMALVERLASSGNDIAAFIAEATLASLSPALAEESRRWIASTYLRWADATIRSDRAQAARFTYNAAQMLGTLDLEKCVSLLERAGELDPSYRDRDYWARELGGAKFLAGDHHGAAEAYRRAAALGRRDVIPLLADSLLLSGKFREAADLFESVIQDEELTTAEWRLKHRVLGFLLDQMSDLESATDNRVKEARRDWASEMLGGRLDPELLFARGNTAVVSGTRSTEWYLAAAVAAETSPIGWALALVSASEEAPELIDDVASCAHRFVGEDLIDFLSDLPAGRERLSEVRRLFESMPPEREPSVHVRVFDPHSGDYRTLALDA